MTSGLPAATENVLVVTTPGSVSAEQRRSPRVASIATLRQRLREGLAPDVWLADPLVARLALARVAPEAVQADRSLAAIARRNGRAWLRVVDGLHEALQGLAGRDEALRQVARGDDALAARARLLAQLSRGVDAALREAGLVDPRREAELVAERVAHADGDEVAGALGATEVRARGIVEWDEGDAALFRVLDACLSRVGGRAIIELPVIDRPLDAERERDALDQIIEAVASALDDAPLTTPVASPLTAGIAGRASGTVEVRRATSKEAQARAVADAVHGALTEGATPSEVLVALVSEDEAAAATILRALALAEIPAVDARRTRPRGSGLTAFADHALLVAENGLDRLDVAGLLRSPYVDPRALLGHPDRESGRRTLRELARALSETPTAKADTALERLEATVRASTAARRRSGAPLALAALRIGQSLARAAGAHTRREHAKAARALWRDLGLGLTPTPSPALSRSAKPSQIDLADLKARARDADAWSLWMTALSSYELAVAQAGLSEVEAPLETFRHELAWATARAATTDAECPNAVRVIHLRDLCSEPRALVVLADADASSWPDGRTHGELLPPALEDRLSAASDPALRPLRQARRAEANARAILGTSNARRVVATMIVRDEDGGARIPAPLIAPLVGESALWRASPAMAAPLSHRDWVLATLAHSPERAGMLVPDVARRAGLERMREEAFGAELGESHPLVATFPRGEPYAAILAEETGGGARPIAASSMDTLASCAYRGFVTDVLRPRRSREAHDIADPREWGQLAHLAVEEAFRATAGLWRARPRDGESILSIGMAAADRALLREEAASNLARVTIDLARTSVRAVLEWSLADETWDFALAEQAFGDSGEPDSWEPVVLEAQGVRVSLRGRIDRVDVSHDGSAVRVIDYKRSQSAAESHTLGLGITRFQTSLYARAATRALSRDIALGAYVGMQRLRPHASARKERERWDEAHELVTGAPRYERRLLDLVQRVRRGELAVRPFDASSCDHCDYAGVCRKPKFAPAAPIDERSQDERR